MIILLFLLFFLLAVPVQAKYDPRTVQNNRFGIHVADPNDIAATAALLNTNGGDWGYVTIVIPETDRNAEKWQGIFDQMRRLHLIPLVRLATHVENAAWKVPTEQSLRDWIDFLTRLNWPTENQYIILFNEPNHAKEWGDTIDPEGYARILAAFARALRDAHEDFFILPAGMDVSARSDSLSLDAAEYLRRMHQAVPDVFTLLDGWTSHAYPNPAFSGSPYATGRGTLWSFVWELSLLSGWGIDTDLPVFITETGWVHKEGKVFDGKLLSAAQVGENQRIAAQTAWNDPRVVAVTPFVFNYQDIPFDHFSWKKLGVNEFYEHYVAYQQLPKAAGTPKQRHMFHFAQPLIPPQLVSGSTYTLEASITNAGQSILTPQDFKAQLTVNGGVFQSIFDPLPTLEPHQEGMVKVHLQTPPAPGTYNVQLSFVHKGETIEIASFPLELVPPPSLALDVQLGWQRTSNSEDVTVLVYDEKDHVLHKFPGLRLEKGTIRAEGLTNIVPGHTYRIVALVPYYLPRQTIAQLGSTQTELMLSRFLPLDFNNDGALTAADVPVLLSTQPQQVIRRFFEP